MNILKQFVESIKNCFDAVTFIKKHKLWGGINRNPLVFLAMVIVTALIGWQLFQSTVDVIHYKDLAPEGQQASFFGTVKSSYGNIFSGGLKYVILIALELFIFHVIIRANNIINGVNEKLTSALFIKAQIRMIKVTIYVFVLEIVLSAISGIGLGILGLNGFKAPVKFAIQSFCIGYAIIDNYYELLDLKIKESFTIVRSNFIGIALGIGLVLNLFFFVPVIGPVVGTIIAAVAVSLTLNKYDPVTNYQ